MARADLVAFTPLGNAPEEALALPQALGTLARLAAISGGLPGAPLEGG